jgi:zinc transport system substrate-binding protein
MLEEADLVFWIGEDLEAFMEKPLESLAKDAQIISFMELGSIEKLKFREENVFDDHDDHDGHEDEHEGHDDHAGHEGHNHGEFDAHIWLDPMNAKEMVHEIAHELSELDPSNKESYEANANRTLKSLDKLIEDVDKAVPKDISYIVFHDAYQYFEKRFGVSSAGALTLNPDVLPGAKQIADVQDLISDKGIKCIFSEPQYNPKIIETLASDMNISTGIMDPLGAYLDKGNTMYEELIKEISNSIKKCS